MRAGALKRFLQDAELLPGAKKPEFNEKQFTAARDAVG
jgi:hypothetical protein